MFRFRLRTLLIVLALGPPVLAGAWWAYRSLQPRAPVEVEFEVIYLDQTGDRRYIFKDGKRVLPLSHKPPRIDPQKD